MNTHRALGLSSLAYLDIKVYLDEYVLCHNVSTFNYIWLIKRGINYQIAMQHSTTISSHSHPVDLDRGSMQLFLWTDNGQGWRNAEGVAWDWD